MRGFCEILIFYWLEGDFGKEFLYIFICCRVKLALGKCRAVVLQFTSYNQYVRKV